MRNDEIYLLNYGLVGINGITKIIDLYLTYRGMELDPNFVEYNPIMRKIIHNKLLTYLISTGYVGFLAGLNYLTKKIAEYAKYDDLNKIATFGLGFNLIINLYIIFRNLNTLRNIKNNKKV